MARQRRNNQDCRLVFELAQCVDIVSKPLEPHQITEWFANFSAFVNRDFDVPIVDGLNVKGWLFIVFAQAVNQVIASGHTLHERILSQGRRAVAVQFRSSLRKVNKWLHQSTLSFVDLVKHRVSLCGYQKYGALQQI